MIEKLEELQSKLRSKCHVFLHHEEYFGWAAGITTDRNEAPYWISFSGETPKEAIEKLLLYFEGKLEDHTRSKRKPEVFLTPILSLFC